MTKNQFFYLLVAFVINMVSAIVVESSKELHLGFILFFGGIFFIFLALFLKG